MKVRLVEDLQLILTPENYVEQVALAKWVDTHQGAGGLLVEAYAEQARAVVEPDVTEVCLIEYDHLRLYNNGFNFCYKCGQPLLPKSSGNN